jgi:hypothetical protein
MQPVVLVILIAGAVVAGFLFLAALLWGIRSRRGEEDFIPIPAEKPRGRLSGADSEMESIPEWLRASDTSESSDEMEAAADWMQSAKSVDPGNDAEPERLSSGADYESPFQNLLHTALPQFSTIMDLGKLAEQIQSEEGFSGSAEERTAALRKALDRMLEDQPGNEFLIQMRKSIPSEDGSEMGAIGND